MYYVFCKMSLINSFVIKSYLFHACLRGISTEHFWGSIILSYCVSPLIPPLLVIWYQSNTTRKENLRVLMPLNSTEQVTDYLYWEPKDSGPEWPEWIYFPKVDNRVLAILSEKRVVKLCLWWTSLANGALLDNGHCCFLSNHQNSAQNILFYGQQMVPQGHSFGATFCYYYFFSVCISREIYSSKMHFTLFISIGTHFHG